MGFCKKCWEVVKDDLFDCVTEFYWNAILPKMVIASFIALIPKMINLQDFTNYHPICLISIAYKFLAKLLENRLKKVIGSLV